MKVCDEVARWLEEKNITHAFGIIGGGNIALWDAIARRGYTHLITAHHEQAAAMASAYFNRMAGRLGSVALVTTGAGSTNAITGVMAAHMDGIPLLVISGNEAFSYIKAGDGKTRVLGVQGYNSVAVAHGFSKATCRLLDEPTNVLDTAKWFAASNRHGPVWIDIPKDVQNASV